jgi:hypothetical protein
MFGKALLDSVFSGTGGIAETLSVEFGATASLMLDRQGEYVEILHDYARKTQEIDVPFVVDSNSINNESGTKTSSPSIVGYVPMTAIENLGIKVGQDKIRFDGKIYQITGLEPYYSGQKTALVRISGR